MKKPIRFLIDLLFPNRCPACNKFIRWDKLICDECAEKLERADACGKCGKPQCICKRDLHYDRAFVLYRYDGTAKQCVAALKDGFGLNAAEFFGRELGLMIKESGEKADYIVAAPMTYRKKRARGYNQAEKIAEFVSEITDVPVERKALKKLNDTTEQHTLSADKRTENVRNMYAAGKTDIIKGKTVIFCDDVITTASTANECSRILKDAGAVKVIVAAATTTILRNGT